MGVDRDAGRVVVVPLTEADVAATDPPGPGRLVSLAARVPGAVVAVVSGVAIGVLVVMGTLPIAGDLDLVADPGVAGPR